MRSLRNSTTLKKARDLLVACCAATEGFPEEETLGLASDVRTSATMIVVNMVKALSRRRKNQGKRRLQNAISSSFRLETYLLLSRDLGYMRPADYDYLQTQVDQMKRNLNLLIGRLVLKRNRPRK